MNTVTRMTTLSVAMILLASCAAGSAVHKQGLEAAQAGNYARSIELLAEAVRQDPGNMTYRLDLKAHREAAIQTLMAAGDAARAAGDLEAAERYFRSVLAIEERNGRALRGLDAIESDRAHNEVVTEAERLFNAGEIDEAAARLRAVLAENPAATSASRLLERIEASRTPAPVTPKLRTANNSPVTLQFRDADTKMVFEVLSRQTGINFIFDKDVRGDRKTTIFVQNVPIEQAIDLVINQNQLGRQVLSENMVLIYPNTPVKQLEYQDQIIKTFYLSNADPKQFAELLKSLLNVQTVFVDARANAVVVRDTPEIMRMAENLQASVDLPESEVMMEVEVLELTRSKLEQLGIQYPGAVTLNPTPLAGDPLVLADLNAQDSTTITVSNVPLTIDLTNEVGRSNLLASPRIRARNHEQAKVLIGQRVPVITNSVTPTANGQSVVTGNVQYVDVGLTLEVEPTIHLDDEVAIKVKLEVSNIIREIFNSTSGTLAYQIGTRNASTVLRLRDGETQVLAGLIQDSDRVTSNQVPGIGDMPVLGRLFGSKKTSDEKTEIVLSITPRILRSQPRPGSEHTEFWYGTEANVRRAPIASTVVSASTGNVPAAGITSRSTAAGNRNTLTDAVDPKDRGNTPPPSRLALNWDGPGQVSVGETFEIALRVNSPAELASLNTRLRFDQSVLELTGADVGEFLPAGLRTAAVPEDQGRVGRYSLNVPLTDSLTASGEGSLVLLKFRALSARPQTMIAVQQFAAQGPDALSVPVIAPRPFIISVQSGSAQ